MQAEKLNAIVLSANDYGDSDRIVSLFTLEHGRVRAFAKSARKSRKRFGGMLETGNRLEISMALPDDRLARLEKVESGHCHPFLRERLESLALLLYCCELVETLTPEGDPLPRLYRLLASLIGHLDHNPATIADRRFYEINMLNILGYRPVMSDMTLTPLHDCLKTARFGSVVFTEDELSRAGRLLDNAIASHALKPLKSTDFLEEMMKRR